MGLFGWGKKKDEEKDKAEREHAEARRKMEEAKRKGRQDAGLAPASTAGTGLGTTVPAATGTPAAAGTEYTVQSGDSLSKIAQRHLGDANRWPEIHQANRAVIGDNPDLIKPGQRLRIPGGGTPTQTA